MSENNDKLKAILEEILLIDDNQYNDSYGPDEIETWDSLATINIANAVEKAFGYSMSPEEIVSLETIGDIKTILISKGVEI
ncbi:MAG: acyl carrier protein [Aliifodinibius sp.]|nr:acyl carrier protein [candidate division Zixibacteria bacterium]NIT56496.1 acyl carrier protein [Fodinibius sp.]NIV11480.1 acyl carrier protein [Fodinibius sp.]NIY25079.1 acyl carrier protein [Fodinibius sp.]